MTGKAIALVAGVCMLAATCGMYAAGTDYVRSVFPNDAVYDSTNFTGN